MISLKYLYLSRKTLIESGERKRNRTSRLSHSKIMIIIIAFHMSHHRDFKNYYLGLIRRCHLQNFPNVLSYTRFLEVMLSIHVPLNTYLTSLKDQPTGIEIIDSKSIKVCHNLRIPRHKVFDNVAQKNKGMVLWLQVSCLP